MEPDMIKNLFTEHPSSVGESYFQHMGVAFSFTLSLAYATFACLVHAFLPFLFVKTGSHKITELHDRMVANRHNQTPNSDKFVAPHNI